MSVHVSSAPSFSLQAFTFSSDTAPPSTTAHTTTVVDLARDDEDSNSSVQFVAAVTSSKAGAAIGGAGTKWSAPSSWRGTKEVQSGRGGGDRGAEQKENTNNMFAVFNFSNKSASDTGFTTR